MTDKAGSGTNGGAGVTGGSGFAVRPWMALLAFVAVAIFQSTMNVFSTLADRAGTGVLPWQVWLWEFSSLAVWLVLAPLIWIAVARLRPPRVSWPIAALAFAALTLPVSAIHVSCMVAIRKLVYATMGTRYVFAENLPAEFLYEYRKDVATIILFAGIFALAQWIFSRQQVPVAADAPAMLTIRDGSTAYQVPAEEIDLVSAAGNYVEIDWAGRTLLHRATLGAVEAELAGCGFVRIHRSTLVRRAAIRRIETAQSGDFTITLQNGAEAKGSRRYRSGLDR